MNPTRAWLARHADAVWAGVLLVGSLWLFGHGIGDYPLWDPWEPKYAQTLREMDERDSLITPWFDDRIRWTKPILIYWAMGVPMALAGNNEFTARLPSVLAATACVLFLFFFVKRLYGRRAGVIAACVLATLPQYFYLARQAMPDMLLTAFLGAAMGCFALARFGTERRRLWYGLFYAAVALAFLTKGPVACVIVLGALGIFWLIDADPVGWRSPRALRAKLNAAWSDYHVGMGLVVFTVIAAPWYVAIYLKYPAEFIERFVMDENVQRFTEPIRDHHGTAQFYVKEFFHAMYPWSGLLPVGLLFLFQGLRKTDKIDDEFRRRWYWISWCLAIFLLFTVAGTKLDHYLLPIMPAVAILVALVLESCFREDAAPWARATLLVSVPFVLIPIRDFLVEGDRYLFSVFSNGRDIEHPGLATGLKLMLAAWTVAMLVGFFSKRSRVAIVLAVLVAYGNALYMSHDVLPAHSPSRTMKFYLDRFAEVSEPDAELVFYGKIRYSTHYYFGRKNYRHFDSGEVAELAEYVRGKPHVYIISRTSVLNRLARELRGRAGMRLYPLASEHPRYHLITNVHPKQRKQDADEPQDERSEG